jgi:hypothetical protein
MENTHTYGRITPGLTTIGIGVIHQVVGAAAGLGLLPAVSGSTSAPLLDLWRSGIIGQAEADPLRMELSGGKLSRDLAWGLGGLCALGVLLMPASGFWLGFIPATQIWTRAASGRPRVT